ncbi:MAG: tRNA preQ1(34) S-adenosylmethionine ribosyltransferase-isomerase QueA [Desulforegulaceae bacterium]|nr:tRNA preQ1(34) S-adenosylmethionine ribosyltransferase-isomerase QueA [Desulforegulaceae bacterium]
MYSINDYDFYLPQNLIAQNPAEKRDQSRLFYVPGNNKSFKHLKFQDICSFLSENDLLVINNTKVVPARLFGKKESGGKVEILILDYLEGLKSLEKKAVFECFCLVRASRRPKINSKIFITENLTAEVKEIDGKKVKILFKSKNDILKEIDTAGELPLPPYIKRENKKNLESDKFRYQTVYAKNKGAAAAPTAGLHFTDELMKKIRNKGADFAEITLYVGYGTFSPVECDDIREHNIHREKYFIDKENALKINEAVKKGKRIIAVGTTSVRTLEFACENNGFISSGEGCCDLYIYPGYKFKIVDSIITNFHLPKSTLLMLVSAFAGFDIIKKAYKEAVENQYRFFSYGDSMFLETRI